jgi:hypothetical protein
METTKDLVFVYNTIKEEYEQLLKELMKKDCKNVEFIRGMLFVYSKILNNQTEWERDDCCF